ncbi:MAG: hypothetical protein PWQ43_1338 [Rikenellaceae bacterium]|nr:hypothetical protein [Rikenellaceae bacterium]
MKLRKLVDIVLESNYKDFYVSRHSDGYKYVSIDFNDESTIRKFIRENLVNFNFERKEKGDIFDVNLIYEAVIEEESMEDISTLKVKCTLKRCALNSKGTKYIYVNSDDDGKFRDVEINKILDGTFYKYDDNNYKLLYHDIYLDKEFVQQA